MRDKGSFISPAPWPKITRIPFHSLAHLLYHRPQAWFILKWGGGADVQMHFSVFSFLFASVAMGYPFCNSSFQSSTRWPGLWLYVPLFRLDSRALCSMIRFCVFLNKKMTRGFSSWEWGKIAPVHSAVPSEKCVPLLWDLVHRARKNWVVWVWNSVLSHKKGSDADGNTI